MDTTINNQKTPLNLDPKTTSNLIKNNQQLPKHNRFPSLNKFSVEIDPFSNNSPQFKEENFSFDPFEAGILSGSGPFKSEDPFSIFDSINQEFSYRMSENSEVASVDSTKIDEAKTINDESNVKNESKDVKNEVKIEEVNIKAEEKKAEDNSAPSKETPVKTEPSSNKKESDINDLRNEISISDDSDNEFATPVLTKKNSITTPVTVKKLTITPLFENESEQQDSEDVDEQFSKFANEKPVQVDSLPSLENELAEASMALKGVTVSESNTDFDNEFKRAFKNDKLEFKELNLNGYSSDDSDSSDEVKEYATVTTASYDRSTLRTTEEDNTQIEPGKENELNQNKQDDEPSELRSTEPFKNRVNS